jgi:hypothetical protein
MKSKIQLSAIFFLIIIGIFAPASYSQLPTYKLTLTNDSLTAPNVYEFDIYILRTGSNIFQMFLFQGGFLYDSTALNGGTLKAAWVPGSFDTSLVSTKQINNALSTENMGIIKIAPKAAKGFGNGAIISNVAPGTKLGRLRLTASRPFNIQKAHFTYSYAPPWRTLVFAYDYTTHKNSDITNRADNYISFKFSGVKPPSKK